MDNDTHDSKRDLQLLRLGARISRGRDTTDEALELRRQLGRALCDTIPSDALRDPWADIDRKAIERAAAIADACANRANQAADDYDDNRRDADALGVSGLVLSAMSPISARTLDGLRDLADRARAAAGRIRNAVALPRGWTKRADYLAALGLTEEQAGERDVLDWICEPATIPADETARTRAEARAWILKAAAAYAVEATMAMP